MRAIVVAALAAFAAACVTGCRDRADNSCYGYTCTGTNSGGSSGGGGSGGGAVTPRFTVATGYYTGTRRLPGGGVAESVIALASPQSIEVISPATGQGDLLFPDYSGASMRGEAFALPQQGRTLPDGSPIDAGRLIGTLDQRTGNVTLSIDFESLDDPQISLTRDRTISERPPSSLGRPTGLYIGTLNNGIGFRIAVSSDGSIQGNDSRGCRQTGVIVAAREPVNVYSFSLENECQNPQFFQGLATILLGANPQQPDRLLLIGRAAGEYVAGELSLQ